MTRDRLRTLLDSPPVRTGIIALICLNAVTLGLETSERAMAAAGPVILAIDRICLIVFTVEVALKIYAFGTRFPRSAWNVFDLVIVAISWAPVGQGASVLRALRILRVLRVISVAPRLRRVVEGFVTALPGMGSVFVLMGIIFYIGAVMATKLFGTCAVGPETALSGVCTAEQAALFDEWFGSLPRSLYSLFQVMTLESWSMGIVRPVMEEWPYAWAFFVPFIMVTTFAVVNLLVGLIVNSMQEAHSEEEVAATDAYRDEVLERLRAIEAHLDVAGAAGRVGDKAPERGGSG